MLVVGLTGSIATGKSETSKLFSQANIPVFDADAEVHKIYQHKSVVEMLRGYFPDAIENGEINRQILGKLVLTDAKKLEALETLIHPLVQAEREKFISVWKARHADFVVMDIPLLFETEQSEDVDYVVVVSTSDKIQRERALSRAGMTDEKLAGILFRQVPDSEKRKRADFVIENSGSLAQLREQVEALISKFKSMSGKQDNERNRT
jgi:dephospho-CoA kinase